NESGATFSKFLNQEKASYVAKAEERKVEYNKLWMHTTRNLKKLAHCSSAYPQIFTILEKK
ncbi:hypothetical protein MKW98_014540, partial [Papaver atlanticum]